MIGALLRTITGADKRAMLSGGSFDAMDWLIGSRSAAGVEVTPNGALASTTVMACVTLIARSLASVPLVTGMTCRSSWADALATSTTFEPDPAVRALKSIKGLALMDWTTS